jgi:hypothetical protein
VKHIDELWGEDITIPRAHVYRAAQTVVDGVMTRLCKSLEYVAERLDTTKSYLYGVLNPKKTEKPLSVDRAMDITELSYDPKTGRYDLSIIDEMCKPFGGRIIHIQDHIDEKLNVVSNLVDSGFSLEEMQGQLAKHIRESIKDGNIDEIERVRLKATYWAIVKEATKGYESL